MQTQPLGDGTVYALRQRLDAEFDRYHRAIAYIPIGEARLQEDLRRYLCLRCAGFLEQLAYECVHRLLDTKSSGPPLSFAKSYFSRAPNLTASRLFELVERFGADYSEQLSAVLTSPLRDSLNDLYEIRNPVAHGKEQGGQKLDPERYRKLCIVLYDWFIGSFLEPVGTSTR